MIEFSGSLSSKCKKYILRQESKVGLIAGGVIAAIFCAPAIILNVKIHISFLLSISILLLFALLAGMPPSKKNYSLIMPSKIVINFDTDTVISKSDRFCIEEAVSDIVLIADMGEWYHIYFGKKIDRLGRFVCQKDLIYGCTIEEFEEIFNKVIVKK